ncbi:MAG: hypothetical protein HYS17_06685 [Micavibrio aeruginosavorus]|uniref:Uncharacterized protein n=1 Tax=Micavibrio aeruginosavorus TaxID=349221 RepID=A0A7T5R0H3_9BACT|nr:MAG: hypothetical protein HYS17_06685 [Micavibrio aeruginosavorus]
MRSFLRNSFLRLAVIGVAGLAGGAAASLLVSPVPSKATSSAGTEVSNFFSVYDGLNSKGIETYVNNGYPAQNIYATDGMVRLQQGLYTQGAEAGLPMVAFWDNGGSMRMLFRLAGGNQSPVIVMKDRVGRDRVVFGLNLNDPAEEPFMAVFDNAGNKKMLFGAY